MDHATLTGLLELPKLKTWIEGLEYGVGYKSNASRCLIAEYVKTQVIAMGAQAHQLGVYVGYSTCSIRIGRYQPIEVNLPPAFRDLVRTVDHGATSWISRERALDIVNALLTREVEAAQLERVTAGTLDELLANAPDDDEPEDLSEAELQKILASIAGK